MKRFDYIFKPDSLKHFQFSILNKQLLDIHNFAFQSFTYFAHIFAAVRFCLRFRKVRDGESSFRYCYRNIPRTPDAMSEYLLPILLITAIQPMSHSVLRDARRPRGFPLMIPANENDWQLKYYRLVLWRNATWRRTDKDIDPNGRTISVRSPFLTIQLPFTVYVSFLGKIRSLYSSSA